MCTIVWICKKSLSPSPNVKSIVCITIVICITVCVYVCVVVCSVCVCVCVRVHVCVHLCKRKCISMHNACTIYHIEVCITYIASYSQKNIFRYFITSQYILPIISAIIMLSQYSSMPLNAIKKFLPLPVQKFLLELESV